MPRPTKALAFAVVAFSCMVLSSLLPNSATTPVQLTAGCPTDIGISPGWNLTEPDSDLANDLSYARNVGARTYRFDLDWSVVERVQGTQDWTLTDRMVNAILSRGMKPLAVLAYSPTWAQIPGTNSSHSAPANPAAFAAFANRAASRYATMISDWEIRNEPNLSGTWLPAPDPVAYSQLLTLAAANIRAAQPSANVIAGALAPASDAVPGQIDPVTFTQAIYANGARNSFNTISIHPYTFPALPTDPSTSSWSTFQKIPLVRTAMIANGDSSKPIWITEFGAPTGTGANAVTPAFQATYLTDGIKSARSLGYVTKILIYSLRDSGTSTADIE